MHIDDKILILNNIRKTQLKIGRPIQIIKIFTSKIICTIQKLFSLLQSKQTDKFFIVMV